MKHAILRTKIVPSPSQQYASKIVFDNLEQVINELGYVVQRVEARESGQGTAMATRSKTRSAIESELDLPVTVQLVPHQNRHYNTKIVLVGLQEGLGVQGVEVESCETRASGLGTAIALRAQLSRVQGSVIKPAG